MRILLMASTLLFIPMSSMAQPKGEAKLPDGVTKIADVTYAERPTGKLLLDLYVPTAKPSSPLPVVVWVHGGGWSGWQQGSLPGSVARGRGL